MLLEGSMNDFHRHGGTSTYTPLGIQYTIPSWGELPGYSDSLYVTIMPRSSCKSFYPPSGSQEAKDYDNAYRKIRSY